MVVTLTSITDAFARIVFTWSDDLTTCTFVEFGSHDIDAVMKANGHEGADVAGYTVTVA